MRSTSIQGEASSSSSKQSSNVQHHGTAKRTRLLRITGRSLLGVMILVGLAIFICWLIVFPKTPNLFVESGRVIPQSLTDRKLKATIVFTVKSYNPNTRASIRMDSLTMIITDMGQTFWSVIPNFIQPPRNQTVLNLTVHGNFIYPFGHMKELMLMEGIHPQLRFSAKISYTYKRWTSKQRTLEVYCNHLKLKINGSTPFDNTKCNVDL